MAKVTLTCLPCSQRAPARLERSPWKWPGQTQRSEHRFVCTCVLQALPLCTVPCGGVACAESRKQQETLEPRQLRQASPHPHRTPCRQSGLLVVPHFSGNCFLCLPGYRATLTLPPAVECTAAPRHLLGQGRVVGARPPPASCLPLGWWT